MVLPVPLVAEVIESHGVLLLMTIHAQPDVVVILVLPVPPFAVKFCAVELIE